MERIQQHHSAINAGLSDNPQRPMTKSEANSRRWEEAAKAAKEKLDAKKSRSGRNDLLPALSKLDIQLKRDQPRADRNAAAGRSKPHQDHIYMGDDDNLLDSMGEGKQPTWRIPSNSKPDPSKADPGDVVELSDNSDSDVEVIQTPLKPMGASLNASKDQSGAAEGGRGGKGKGKGKAMVDSIPETPPQQPSARADDAWMEDNSFGNPSPTKRTTQTSNPKKPPIPALATNTLDPSNPPRFPTPVHSTPASVKRKHAAIATPSTDSPDPLAIIPKRNRTATVFPSPMRPPAQAGRRAPVLAKRCTATAARSVTSDIDPAQPPPPPQISRPTPASSSKSVSVKITNARPNPRPKTRTKAVPPAAKPPDTAGPLRKLGGSSSAYDDGVINVVIGTDGGRMEREGKKEVEKKNREAAMARGPRVVAGSRVVEEDGKEEKTVLDMLSQDVEDSEETTGKAPTGKKKPKSRVRQPKSDNTVKASAPPKQVNDAAGPSKMDYIPESDMETDTETISPTSDEEPEDKSGEYQPSEAAASDVAPKTPKRSPRKAGAKKAESAAKAGSAKLGRKQEGGLAGRLKQQNEEREREKQEQERKKLEARFAFPMKLDSSSDGESGAEQPRIVVVDKGKGPAKAKGKKDKGKGKAKVVESDPDEDEDDGPNRSLGNLSIDEPKQRFLMVGGQKIKLEKGSDSEGEDDNLGPTEYFDENGELEVEELEGIQEIDGIKVRGDAKEGRLGLQYSGVNADNYCSKFINPHEICVFCDEALPVNPTPGFSKTYTDLRSISRPNPTAKNPQGRSLDWTRTIAVCAQHRAETRTIPLGVKAGYPTSADVDWDYFEKRCTSRKVMSKLEQLLREPTKSGFWMLTQRDMEDAGGRRAWLGVKGQQESGRLQRMQPGYYGDRGKQIMTRLLQTYLDSHFSLITPPNLEPLTIEDLVPHVLVPEIAVVLVQEDLGPIGKGAEGRALSIRIVKESNDYGRAVFPSISERGVPGVGSPARKKVVTPVNSPGKRVREGAVPVTPKRPYVEVVVPSPSATWPRRVEEINEVVEEEEGNKAEEEDVEMDSPVGVRMSSFVDPEEEVDQLEGASDDDVPFASQNDFPPQPPTSSPPRAPTPPKVRKPPILAYHARAGASASAVAGPSREALVGEREVDKDEAMPLVVESRAANRRPAQSRKALGMR